MIIAIQMPDTMFVPNIFSYNKLADHLSECYTTMGCNGLLLLWPPVLKYSQCWSDAI